VESRELRKRYLAVLPLSLILLTKRHKYNKEDKMFLLVKLRIAIQRTEGGKGKGEEVCRVEK
jgi:hypothetical protein